MSNVFKHFAKKWNVSETTMRSIYSMIQVNDGRYGKTRRTLVELGMNISARQMRYFVRRVRLEDRLNVKEKGKPKNYSQLLRNST